MSEKVWSSRPGTVKAGTWFLRNGVKVMFVPEDSWFDGEKFGADDLLVLLEKAERVVD